MRGVVIIEFDVKAVEICHVLLVHLLDHLFGADAGCAGANHNRSAVGVIGAKSTGTDCRTSSGSGPRYRFADTRPDALCVSGRSRKAKLMLR